MDSKQLQTKVTEIEIARLMSDENMLEPGRDIVRRLAFELSILRNQTWEDAAYAKLEAVGNKMPFEDFEIIQRFLETGG